MANVIDLNTDDGRLTQEVVDSLFRVHKIMGPGLLEGVYEDCLCLELARRDIPFERQKSVSLYYDGTMLAHPLRLDLVVDGRIIIELKSVAALSPLHEAQLLGYLKAAKMKIGFLVNFNVPLIKDGIKRFVHRY